MMQVADPEQSWGQKLLHRWFVEYNPLYLLSASLVLVGMIFISRGLAQAGSVHGQIGVAAIAELYAIALIGGAALLMRIGHRRPAVMLALLTVLYQWDMTLHTEACSNLGVMGAIATTGWLVVFVAKLYALAWAMRIRLAPSAVVTLILGGLGLVVLPYVLDRVSPRAATSLVALWACLIMAAFRDGAVTTRVELDVWGHTVHKRAVRASWILSATLLVLHALFWSLHHILEPRVLLAVVPVMATRWIRTESRAWGAIVATLILVALALPAGFSVTALAAAIALVARAVDAERGVSEMVSAQSPTSNLATPYRISGDEPISLERMVAVRASRLRLFTGAAMALYLASWTMSWSGGLWPAHDLGLDVLLTVVALVAVLWLRLRAAIAPVALVWMHFFILDHLLMKPHSELEWGGIAVGTGFALLIASLAASYWLRSTNRESELVTDCLSGPHRRHGYDRTPSSPGEPRS